MVSLTRRVFCRSLVAVLLAGFVIVPTAAGTVQPQADIPDLSAMAVGVADLPRGAKISSEGSVRFPGAVAAYERTLGYTPRAAARTGLALASSQVALFEDAGEASALFGGARHELDTRRGRRQFVSLVARELGVSPRRVKVSKARAVRIGDEAFWLSVAVKVERQSIHMRLAFVRVDRVLAQLTVAGLGRKASFDRRTRTILDANAAHVRTGLSPVSTSPPAVSGTAHIGAVLNGDAGAWSPATAPTAIAYQWQRCDAGGAACVAIPGATGTAYTVAPSDTGTTLRLAVTASNSVGETTAVSAPTTVTP